MTVISSLELAGSPVEQASYQRQTWYWDPAAEILTDEVIDFPTAQALQYDPSFSANYADAVDVTTTILLDGQVTIGLDAHANMVAVTVLEARLRPGYEYRIMLSCLGNLGSTPARYFRIKCRI